MEEPNAKTVSTIVSNPEDDRSNRPRRGLRRGIAVMTIALVVLCAVTALLVAIYPQGCVSFYLTFPSMSRAEFEAIVRKAHAGVPESQLYYGIFYANGDGVWQDYSKAAAWYEKAAEQGNPRAQRNLGLLYDASVGVKQSYSKALEWYFVSTESMVYRHNILSH